MTNRPPAAAASVRLERMLPAAMSTVYAAWTDPDLLSQWMSPFGTATAEADVRVGGSLRITMIGDGTRIDHTGEFLDLDPPRLLRFTWNSPYSNGASVVTVVLEPEGDQTRLVLTHERLPADVVGSHAGGWSSMLERLSVVLAPERGDIDR